MAEETQKLYAAIFGTDSEDETDSDTEQEQEQNTNFHGWQPVEGVDGLWRCEVFLDAAEQESLVRAIEAEGWFANPSHNQAMRFGTLPGWALKLSSIILTSISSFQKIGLGLEEILARKPLFDQMIVNSYQPGEGIGTHVDLARFEDGIAVLSLLSPCVMRFRRFRGTEESEDVLLCPGDLILLSGSARYEWTHEITRERAEDQVWDGKVVEQGRRISVTLRRLCPEDTVKPN